MSDKKQWRTYEQFGSYFDLGRVENISGLN